MNHNAEISPPLSKTIQATEFVKDEYESDDLPSISLEEKKAITRRILFKLDVAYVYIFYGLSINSLRGSQQTDRRWEKVSYQS